MVSTFDGQQWRPAADPQPGTADGSQGGSFAPSLGDALFEHYRVPIAVASTGAGATSVRQWLPKGGRMQQLPTIDAYVTPVAPGEWASDGQLFDGLARRLEALGPRGCRAVLWHQGESDAGQARAGYPADRQISGRQYAEFLRQVIEASRARAGWELPWLVAQTTYHSEQDPADEEFRAAQRSVVEAGIAVAGPDTDQLRAEFRDGVHFNARGLREHGQGWAKSIVTWLDQDARGGNTPGPSRDRDPGR
jgi:Carbohydrate esterase, sialic acid-specific acetylesterase